VNAVKLLLCLALASPLLTLLPRGQDPDWAKEVERACTSNRYGLRLAAARKVAAGGGASVPALRAFVQQRGFDQLPAAVVDAIADDPNLDPPVLALLREWADLPDFYWRASAMRGLALRTVHLPTEAKALREQFERHHADPAWLMRTHARFGSALQGDLAVLTQPEDDPRATARLAMLLLSHGKLPPLQPLLDALADERTFQGDPWGSRTAADAHKALKTWLGDAHPLAGGGAFPSVEAGLVALRAACATKSGQELRLPTRRTDGDTKFAGGIELLSCKHGDLFVQWTAAGEIFASIDARPGRRLPASEWERLSKERTALPLTQNLGVVICDSMRVRWLDPELHIKIAPASLPAAATEWLKQLAAAIEDAGDPRLAASLRTGLEQFAAR
jgi:hypothetical protein